MPEVKKKPVTGTRMLGVGFEFAAAVAGFTLMGYWVDRHFGHAPWGVIVGVALGLIGGMYNLIRESLAASKEAGSGSQTSNGDRKR
jgi:F0F1-type ATP synthase assembly protein I